MKLTIIIAVLFIFIVVGLALSIALVGPESQNTTRSADEWAVYITSFPTCDGVRPSDRVFTYEGSIEENGVITETWRVDFAYARTGATSVWQTTVSYDAAYSRDAIPRRAIKILRSDGISVTHKGE